MLVQINKSGGHNQPTRMNHTPSAQRLRSYPNNLPPADPDVPHRIQPGLWIHYSAALDHEIQLLCCRDGR
jgi:hypothetical protein